MGFQDFGLLPGAQAPGPLPVYMYIYITVNFLYSAFIFSWALGFDFVFGYLDCERKISQAGENSEAGRTPYSKCVSVYFIWL